MFFESCTSCDRRKYFSSTLILFCLQKFRRYTCGTYYSLIRLLSHLILLFPFFTAMRYLQRSIYLSHLLISIQRFNFISHMVCYPVIFSNSYSKAKKIYSFICIYFESGIIIVHTLIILFHYTIYYTIFAKTMILNASKQNKNPKNPSALRALTQQDKTTPNEPRGEY